LGCRNEDGEHGLQIDWIDKVNGRVAVALSWLDRDDKPHRWAQVLTMKDGGIADLQDYADPDSARKALRRSRRPAFLL
jgi:hypothetical protein